MIHGRRVGVIWCNLSSCWSHDDLWRSGVRNDADAGHDAAHDHDDDDDDDDYARYDRYDRYDCNDRNYRDGDDNDDDDDDRKEAATRGGP